MNILYISSVVPSRNGAGSNIDLSILNKLIGNNNIIDAIILKSNIDHNNVPNIFNECHCTAINNIKRIIRSIVFPFLPGVLAFRLDFLVIMKLFKLRKRKYDILYFSFTPVVLYVFFCKIIMRKTKTIIFIHDILQQAFSRRYNNEKSLIKKLYYWIELRKLELMEFKIYKIFDQCIAVNSRDKEMLVKNNVKAESIIPIYKQYCYSPDNTVDDIFYVCYFGAFNRFENIDAVNYYLNGLHKILIENISNYQFVIIGLDAEKHFSNTRHVCVYGYMEDPSIILNRCRAAVVLLRYGSGIKIKILELLALGITCFCSVVASEGIREMKGIITSDDIKILYEEIYSFYKSGNEKDEIRNEFLRKYNLGSNVKIINKIFYENE
jgi:hypothetical protein